jgi:hypothetical protein
MLAHDVRRSSLRTFFGGLRIVHENVERRDTEAEL